jgi:hypothetical protein
MMISRRGGRAGFDVAEVTFEAALHLFESVGLSAVAVELAHPVIPGLTRSDGRGIGRIRIDPPSSRRGRPTSGDVGPVWTRPDVPTLKCEAS